MLQPSGHSQDQFFDFLEPFSLGVWLWVTAFHIVYGVALKLIASLKRYHATNRKSIDAVANDGNIEDKEGVEEEFDFGWRESFWYFWASFIQLGADRSPKSMEGKILASG